MRFFKLKNFVINNHGIPQNVILIISNYLLDNDCSDHCQNAPNGHRCYCPPDMHLNKTHKNQCLEDRTCNQWGTCSQLCKNVSKRRHKCYCDTDYVLQTDGFNCKSKDQSIPLAVYSSRNELRSINLRTFAMRPLLSSLKNTVALDFFYSKNETLVFWTDVVDDKIYRGTLLNDNSIINIEAIVEHGLGIYSHGSEFFFVLHFAKSEFFRPLYCMNNSQSNIFSNI